MSTAAASATDIEQTCATCGAAFNVTSEDISFYEEISPKYNGKKYIIPPPKNCPDCRQRRRLTWRDERVLYKRPCNKTGKTIISVYSPEKPFTVYDNDAWYEADWDAKSYGRDIDFNRPFFPQFRELLEEVPLLARSTLNLQNSDYTNQCGWSKNCYLTFEADGNENCIYANNMFDCRWSMDSLHVVNCELCFECIDCVQCYNLKYSQDCNNCFDGAFLRNCIGCKSCFGCVNMRNKEFHIFNKPYSKEEYAVKYKELMTGSWSGMDAMRKQFNEFRLKFPHRCIYGVQNEGSTGDHIRNTQRCYDCFDLFNAQDCKHVFNARNTKKVHDLMVFGAETGIEFCYENHEVGDSCRNIVFSDQLWSGCSDIIYSKLCMQNSKRLFGCVGIRHSQNCILNKQYSEEEFQKTAARLVEHMQRTGEWGQPFPSSISPYCYNETTAQQYYPLSPEEAAKRGYTWKDKIIEIQDIPKIIPADKLPDRMTDIPEDILNWAVRCPNTGRPFRIIKQEYDYCKQQNVPLARHHPDERHRLRMLQRNPPKLWNRKCQKCMKEVSSSYAPDRLETVYCEVCFNAAVV